MRSARTAAGVVALLVAAATLSACTGTTGAPGSAAPSSSASSGRVAAGGSGWTALPLPTPGERVVTLTAYGDTLLAGTVSADPTAVPGLLAYAGGSWRRLPVRPSSPYAKLAEWLSVQAASDGRLVAVGGARGGAHANVRWTVWTGSVTAGLTEAEQAFDVFGGWGAGDQTGVVLTGAGPMLVGSWESARTGLDIDVWLPEGATWVRQSPAGTALESTPTELAGARGVAVDGEGALVTGSVLHLGDGAVRQVAAVWVSTSGNTGWTRVDLPDAGAASEAVSAVCAAPQPGACTVAGWVDGRLAVWRLDRAGVRRLGGIPDLAVATRDPIPAPVLVGGRVVLLVGDGAGTALVREVGDGWVREGGPSGGVVAFATVGSTLYAAVRTPDGVGSLWAGPA